VWIVQTEAQAASSPPSCCHARRLGNPPWTPSVMRCPLPPAQTGDTALHLASNKGRLDMVQLMIEHGAKLDVQNKLGQTALHCAAGYGTVPLVKLLLDKGADKTVTDGEGQTPGALAKAYGQEDTAAMLG